MIRIRIGGHTYEASPTQALDVSIPAGFHEAGPRFFGGEGASARPYETGGFVGAVGAGGSCNVSVLTMTPHLDGTHTETIGHLVPHADPPHALLRAPLVPATLASVHPAELRSVGDDASSSARPGDIVIGAGAIEALLSTAEPGFTEALIIRTLPNDESKRTRDYDRQPAPYFTTTAVETIVSTGVRHLVVDTPSIDRWNDANLTGHRVFFGLSGAGDAERSASTITELAFVIAGIADGPYLLNLQVPALLTDAVPSRPVLIPVRRV